MTRPGVGAFRQLTWATVATVVAVLSSTSAAQGQWTPGKVAEVLNNARYANLRARDLQIRVKGEQTKTASILDEIAGISDVVEIARESFANVSDQMLDGISDGIAEMQQVLQTEFAGLEAFRSGPDCQIFRDDLTGLFDGLGRLLDTVANVDRDWAQGPLFQPILVDLRSTQDAVNLAPCSALFPTYRVAGTEVRGASQRIGALVPALHELYGAADHAYSCEQIQANEESLLISSAVAYSAAGGLKGAGLLLTTLGATRNPYVAAHGYTGFTLKNNWKKKVGLLLEGAARASLGVGSVVTAKVRYCQLQLGQQEILQACGGQSTASSVKWGRP